MQHQPSLFVIGWFEQLSCKNCFVSRQRRWTCAVLLRGRLLEIEARERYVLGSLRAFNHPEFRGVSPRVWRPSQTSNFWLNRKQQWSVFSGKRVDFLCASFASDWTIGSAIVLRVHPLGCGKDALSGFEWASPASASASASAVAFCRQAAWRHGAIGCRTMSSFRNIRDRGGAGPNKPLSSCLAGVAMCCKRQAAWRLNGVVLVIPLGHMLGRRRVIRMWVFPGCCGPQANDVDLHL